MYRGASRDIPNGSYDQREGDNYQGRGRYEGHSASQSEGRGAHAYNRSHDYDHHYSREGYHGSSYRGRGYPSDHRDGGYRGRRVHTSHRGTDHRDHRGTDHRGHHYGRGGRNQTYDTSMEDTSYRSHSATGIQRGRPYRRGNAAMWGRPHHRGGASHREVQDDPTGKLSLTHISLDETCPGMVMVSIYLYSPGKIKRS